MITRGQRAGKEPMIGLHGYECDPEFDMMDSYDASYNADRIPFS